MFSTFFISFLNKRFYSDFHFPSKNEFTLPSKGTAYIIQTVNIRTGPSIDATKVGSFSAGDSIAYDSTIEIEHKKWISWISSEGPRYYCAAYDTSDGTTYISTKSPSSDSSGSGLPSSGTAYFLETVNVRTSPSTSSTKVAYYEYGMSVNYDSIVSAEDKYWLSWLNSKGERHYCVAVDKSSGHKYVSTKMPSDSGDLLLPIPQYYQWNYPSTKLGADTIATGGCGPTSFAMVATYLLGKTITPPDAIAWCGSKYYNAGTYWSYFAAAANHFGCGPVQQVAYGSTAYDAMKHKKPVISSQGPGIFTKHGHFIVLRGIDSNGKIMVRDPNDNSEKNHINRHFSLSEITAAGRQYFIFPAKK